MCGADDYCQQLKDEFLKARKAHWCAACHETIPAGHVYHYGFHIDPDGEPLYCKHCLRCWAMFLEICGVSKEPVAFDLDCGEVWEDTIGELPEKVARLAFMSPEDAQKELRPE